MKKYIVILALVFLACSCKGLLDTSPRGEIADGNMWTTPSLSKAGIDGLMYPMSRHVDGLSDLTPTNGKGGINRIGAEGMGYTSILDAGSDMQFLRAATKTASGKDISAEWKSMYTVIHACNKAIARLRKDVVGADLYEQYICEARMIRAFCYTRLTMFFGEVPIYLDETDNAECTKAQDYWDDLWVMIINECTLCIDNPSFQTNNLPGSKRPCKPSKGMAYFLRGNAYMWLAANKNPEIYAGAPGISDSEIQQYYTLAAADLAMVKECGFGLWDGPEWEGFFSYKNEHHKEMIFPLEFTFTDGFSSYWQWVIGSRTHLNSWTRLVPSTEFVNDFEWADGSKFDWSQVIPEWSTLTDAQREVFFLRDSLDTHAARVADGTAVEKDITLAAQREKAISRIGESVYNQYYLDIGNEARLAAAYEGRDPRLAKLVVIPYKPYPMINESSGKPINFVRRWPHFKRQDDVPDSDMIPEFSANMVYLWNKYIVSDGTTLDRVHDGTDWPLIRFTEVQLMQAEALLCSGKVAEAVPLINEVRESAGMPAITSTDPDEVMKELRYETRVSLCQEGKDFFYEIRWGTFKETKFQGKKFWDPRTCWGQGGWKTGYYYVDGMWPLSAPLDEVVMNSNLRRRPNWAY